MNNKSFILTFSLLVMFLLGSKSASAQNISIENVSEIEVESKPKDIIVLNYNMGFATGNTQDFVGDASFRGYGIDYRHFLNSKISIGASVDYQNFYEDMGKQIINYNGSDIYGSQYNWHRSVPILATAHYYVGGCKSKLLKPYVGLGIGAYYGESELMIGGTSFISDGWQFGLAPEVGTFVNINEVVSLSLAARYNNTFETSDLDAQSYVSLKFGVALRF